MSQLGLNLGYLLVQIICFFIIFVVVRAWIVKPLQGLLEKRRKTIAQGLEDARIAAEARASTEKDAAAIIAEAQSKAAQIVNEATQRTESAAREVKAAAEQETIKERENALAEARQKRDRVLDEAFQDRDRILAEARHDRDRILAEARHEARQERDRALAGLRGQVAALSIAAAQQLIGETLNEKRQHALLAEFFSGMKSGKVVVLEGEKLFGERAQVTSALRLTRDEQEKVKSDVVAKMGEEAEVEFRVDPAILGGLVVRVGNKVLDGSIAGQLEGLRQSLR